MGSGSRGSLNLAVLAVSAALAAACSAGTKAATTTSTTLRIIHSTEATVPTPIRPRASLEFREVESSSGSPLIFPANESPCTTKHPSSVASTAILFDRKHQSCYVVGPVLLNGAHVGSASVIYDPTQSQYAVNLHWDNNDFLTKVAGPHVNKEVAIVLNGIVQSAPVINPGITGRDVEITGNLSRADAIDLAASIMGIAPSQVRVDANG